MRIKGMSLVFVINRISIIISVAIHHDGASQDGNHHARSGGDEDGERRMQRVPL